MASSEIAVGDRVKTTKMIRLHTHDGVFEKPPGTEGEVVWVGYLATPPQIGVRFGQGLAPATVSLGLDELMAAGEIPERMPSPTRFLVIPMSTGEAGHLLEVFRELENSPAGLPERAYSLIEDALDDGPFLTIDQLGEVEALALKLAPHVREEGDEHAD